MSGERSKLSKEELREDEFVEWIMRAVDYVRERVQLFAGGLVAIVLLILGINYIIDSQEMAGEEAATKLGDVLMAEESGQVGKVITLAEELIGKYAGTPAAAQGMLVLANRHFSQGNYGEAQRLYETYLDDYGQTDVLIYGAWSGIASCMEAQGNLQDAAAKYQKYAADNPGSVQAAMALMEASRCYGKLGDLPARKELLEQIIKDFGNLPVAAQAKADIAML